MNIRTADAHLALLRECADTCRATLFEHCLLEGGAHVAPDHIQSMMDCIEICRTAVDFMTRGSSQHGIICASCAEICLQCAESCERLSDAVMQHCAAVCHDCAEACQRMASESGHVLAVA